MSKRQIRWPHQWSAILWLTIGAVALALGLTNIYGIVNGSVSPDAYIRLDRQEQAQSFAPDDVPFDRSTPDAPHVSVLMPARDFVRPPSQVDQPFEILFEQYNRFGSSATTSQDFEPAYDLYDSQAADDFIVPPGQTWLVEQFDVSGVYRGQGHADSVDVTIYVDEDDLPGRRVYNAVDLIPYLGLDTGDFTLRLDEPLRLTTGTYWLSVQANQALDPQGQWFWRNRLNRAGALAAWRNLPGGFGRCTDWGTRREDCYISVTEPDQVFRIVGNVEGVPTSVPSHTPTPEGSPTASPTPSSTNTRFPGVPSPVMTVNATVAQPTPTALPACGLFWRQVDSPSPGDSINSLADMLAFSPTDIWAVGQELDQPLPIMPLVEHWNGMEWAQVPVPQIQAGGMLLGISGVSTDDIWAVGADGASMRALSLHWDGVQWQEVDLPVINDSSLLFDVVAISPDDAWAVGASNVGPNMVTVTLHWDGTQWTLVDSPSPGTHSRLEGVSVTPSGEVWAVGAAYAAPTAQPLTMRWDGTQWVVIDTPSFPDDAALRAVVAISPDDVWAVGYYFYDFYYAGTLTMHWDGSTWSFVQSPSGAQDTELNNISYAGPDALWAVGTNTYNTFSETRRRTFALKWNGSQWIRVASTDPSGTSAFEGVVALSGDLAWAAGWYIGAGGISHTLIERYNDPCVTPTPSPTSTGTMTPVPLTSTPTPTPTSTPTACVLGFADVPDRSTFYPYVHCLVCRGIVSGYPCGASNEPCGATHEPYFRPGAAGMRGQIAKIVSNSAGFSEPVSGQTFEDVPPGHTFYEFVERLTRRDVLVGYPCGGLSEPCGPTERPYFRPGMSATRGQTAKIVANAAGLQEPIGGQTFEDVLPGSSYYEFIERLVAIGIVSGYDCGAPEPCQPPFNRPYFRPGAEITRGQISKIVANAFFPECSP